MQLIVEKRDVFKKALKRYRDAGKMPAVLYGAGFDVPMNLFIDTVIFKKAWKEAGESAILDVAEAVPSGESKELASVLIHDVQLNPINDEPVHADLLAVDMDKTITATIPLEFEGESPAVETLGGVLVRVLHEVEIETLPKNLPHEISVDISILKELNDSIAVGDLKLPDGVKVLIDSEEIVALVKEVEEEKEEETDVDFEEIGDAEERGKDDEDGEVAETEENGNTKENVGE